MGLNLFHFLVEKPTLFIFRQSQGMVKGTRSAEQVLAKIGPAINMLLIMNAGKIDSALGTAAHQVAAQVVHNVYDPAKVTGIVQGAFNTLGIKGDLADYGTALVLARLPTAQDATEDAIYKVFDGVRSEIDNFGKDASSAAAGK